MTELRRVVRSLLRTPLVSGIAVVSLALGIGANAAMFTVFDHMLLRPLPVPEPERIVNLLAPGPKSGSNSSGDAGGPDATWSYPMFRDLERAKLPFAGIAAESAFGANLGFGEETLSGTGSLVSGRYFSTLGLRPAVGRLLGPQDDRDRDPARVAVLDHATWRTRFGGDPGVVGRGVMVNGLRLEVVGVLPVDFVGRTLGRRPDVYVPVGLHPQMVPWRPAGFENRRMYFLYVFGRLAPGLSLERAASALNAVYRPILRDVELPLQTGDEDYKARFVKREAALAPGGRGQSRVHEDVRPALLLLLGVTGLVLLIAAANIANLLLVRAILRGGEISVRLALGAQRRQLAALLLAESAVLAAVGGALAVGVSAAILRLFTALLPAESDVASVLDLDARGGIFLAALTGVVALAGLLPALHATRTDLAGVLRREAGRASGTAAASRLRTGLATFQVALSMTLLVVAGLFVRSLANIGGIDLGLDVDRVAGFGLSPELNGMEPAESRAVFERLEAELATIPGVTSVAISRVPLVASSNWTTNVSVEGFEPGPDADMDASFNEVGPGYFPTLGVTLLAGREFTRADTAGSPKVAIVNESFARKFGLGRDAVGKRMQLGQGGELDIEIVGLAADSKYSEVKAAVPPVYFQPWLQNEDVGAVNFYLRTAGDPAGVLAAVRDRVERAAPGVPLENLATLRDHVRDNVFLDQLVAALSVGFAVLATLLATIGLYGVIAYAVAQRTREIGVRMALGASPPEVRRMVLRYVGVIAGVGAVLGLLAAVGLGRVADSILFELEGHDPLAFAGAVVILCAVVLAAGLLPARRASRIDPVTALRGE